MGEQEGHREELASCAKEINDNEILVGSDIETCGDLSEELSNDELYLALEDAFCQSKETDFRVFLQGIIFDLKGIVGRIEGDRQKKMEQFISRLTEVDKKYCEKTGHYYRKEIDKYIKDLKTEGHIQRQSEGFYTRLGLDQNTIKRTPELFTELAVRRELSNVDWTDKIQEFTSTHVAILEDCSIGPLEIKPSTYIKALLLKNGLQYTNDFDRNVNVAIKNGIISRKDQIAYRLKHPEYSLQAFEDILAMCMPKKGEPVRILLNKGGNLKSYLVPIRESYTFSTRDGGHINVSYEELRLMAAVAGYQGKGLRFLSPDEEVKVYGNEIVLEEKLVLNNVVTDICLA